MTWARTPAVGRPASCPDDAVDMGDRVPMGDHLRCSFADSEHDVLKVQGTVLPASGDVLAAGVPDRRVALVREGAGEFAQEVAHATSDAQGHFLIQTRAPAGRYRVITGAGSSPLLEVQGRGPWTLEQVRVLLPLTDLGSPPLQNRVR